MSVEEVSPDRKRLAIGGKMNACRFPLRVTSTLVIDSLILFAAGGGRVLERDPRSSPEIQVSSVNIFNRIHSSSDYFLESCSINPQF